jgi:hydrogenase/urease accessory protein HupE
MLSTAELTQQQAQVVGFLAEKLAVRDGNVPGILSVTPAANSLLPNNLRVDKNSTHTTLNLAYHWSHSLENLVIDYGLFVPNVSTASCLATILHDGKVQSFVFTPENRAFSLALNGPWQQAGSFIYLGIEHILTGYDHILFLISLLMLGGGIKYLLKVITAFTVAHSVTLSLAVLNIVHVPSRWVESAIALTIIYVALENFWRKDVRGRWIITFLFGLIHGLGFATALKEIGIPKEQFFTSLLSFNIGVELGQITIILAAYFLISKWFSNKIWYKERIVYPISTVIACVALYWTIERILFMN